MGRRLLALALLAAAASSPAAARTRVVGGTSAQITSAPWTVYLRQATKSGAELCTGAIVDPLHVLTAAHCVFDSSGALAVPSAFTVKAGISNYVTPAPGDAEQDRGVSSFRVQPGYQPSSSPTPDDVAILALTAPFDLGTPQVQAAALPAASAPFPAGASVVLAGFGRETNGASPDGSLNALEATVEDQGTCGGFANGVVRSADAVAFCAAAAAAVACNGDSGAALVTADTPHTIVGIADAVPAGCPPGGEGLFTAVGAPEILDFIHGSDQPPTAPRADDATYVQLYGELPLRAGSTVTCESGNWEGSPTIRYAFLDTRTNAVLQVGSNGSFTLPARINGDTIGCRAFATNPGGTAVLETTTRDTVQAAPKLEIEHVPPVVTGRGRRVRLTVWLDPPDGMSGKYGVCVTPPAPVGRRVCASRRVPAGGGGGRFALAVTLHIAPNAPVGQARLTVTAAAGASHGELTARVRVARQ